MSKPSQEFKPVGDRTSKVRLREVGTFARSIYDEYCRRSQVEYADDIVRYPYGMPPSENATNFLKREVYRMAIQYRKNGYEKWLQKEAEKIREFGVLKSKSKDSVFNLVFLCVFANDEKWVQSVSRKKRLARALSLSDPMLKDRVGVSAGDRELFVKQLQYADRHKVPANLLCGFLMQSGSPRLIRKKLADPDYLEPARGFHLAADKRHQK